MIIEPTEFELESGAWREITLTFREPPQVDPSLLPVYSGFIYATNQINREVAHMSCKFSYLSFDVDFFLLMSIDAGIVGDYGKARIFVRNTSSNIITGIRDRSYTYVTDAMIPLLNGTEGIWIQIVLAWSTRIVSVEVVQSEGNLLSGFNVR